MAERYFSLQEAEELLPMIGSCLGDALERKKKVEELRNDREQSLSDLQKALVQIQETGCLVKDLEIGLVDFPSLRDGEEVYLCWKLGEERIAFYHSIHEGFAGRKPLDSSNCEEPPPVQ